MPTLAQKIRLNPTLDRESDFDRKVTPVRDETRPAGYRLAASGQEGSCDHQRSQDV